MHRLSMAQALSVWSDLEAAYYGKHNFGSDTAEIYMYRLCQDDPTVNDAQRRGVITSLHRDAVAEQTANAIGALQSILEYFEKTHADVEIEVNGFSLRLCAWASGLDHNGRVAVRVIHEKKKR